MKLVAFSASLLVLLASAGRASAQDERQFLFSGDGVAPSVGRLAIELGGTLAAGGGGIGGIPTLGLRYARGLTGPLDLRASLSALALYNSLDVGLHF